MAESAEATGRRAAVDDTDGPLDPTSDPGSGIDPIMLEPTEAELDEWVARERKRRRAWLDGPDEEERTAWARRERMRRLSQLSDDDREAVMAEWARQMARYPREMRLAAEGMFSLLYRWSRRQMSDFVRAGRDWEDQVARSGRRGRVRLDDDED